MNVFNRVLIFVLLLAIAGAAVAIAVLAWTIPDDSIDWLRDAVNWMDEHNQDTEKAILTAIAVATALIVLVVLLLEVWPRSKKTVTVRDLQGSAAVISTGAIAQRLEEAIRQVPHVSDVKASVEARRKGIEVAMDLHVDADANLAEVTDSAAEAAREVLTNRMHVALARPPHARLHYRELRLRRAGTVEPAETPQPATPTPEGEASAEPPEAAIDGASPPPELPDEPSPSDAQSAEPPLIGERITDGAAVEKKDA